MTTLAIIIIWISIFLQIGLFIKANDEKWTNSITYEECMRALEREKYYIPLRVLILVIILMALC